MDSNLDVQNPEAGQSKDVQPTYVGDTGLKEIKVGNNDINILLLGETGVGKSTFINSFINYVSYKEFNIAEEEEVLVLIPSVFTIYDENYAEREIRIGNDTNEFIETGASATQGTKSYVFPFNECKLRLIDTPGIGDTRGIEQDNKNFENILSYISNFDHLNAICILLKPNSTRLTVLFEFCIKQLLTHLEKSASQNIIFVFTNSRTTFYRPGETMPVLSKLLQSIADKPPHVKIPLERSNIFCLDNEAFRFLVACKNGIKFSDKEKENFISSWDISVEECSRMLKYIVTDSVEKGFTPHQIQNTLSINEARRVIIQLSKPLADINQLVQDNIQRLNYQKEQLLVAEQSEKQLQEKLYVPVVNLRVIELDEPVTVCTALECCSVITIGNVKKYDYIQRCHEPCYLQNVPKEIIGTPELINCDAMRNAKCRHCSCDFSVHMHVYYMTERFEDQVEDDSVKNLLSNTQNNKTLARDIMQKIEVRIKEFNEEYIIITKAMAKFAHFLKKNTITPYNDAYKSYLLYLIEQQKVLGYDCNKQLITSYEKMLKQYDEEKRALEEAFNMATGQTSELKSGEILECVKHLFSLKYMGKDLETLFNSQGRIIRQEHKNTVEYYHNTKGVWDRIKSRASSTIKKVTTYFE